MKDEELVREITLALIHRGYVHDSAFNAVSRLIQVALEKRPINPEQGAGGAGSEKGPK